MIRASTSLPPLALPLALALALSACAATKDYPSLARRPAERVTGTAEVVAPDLRPAPPPAAPSTQFTGRLLQLVEQARGGHRRFADRRGAAERLVAAASGAAQASESWAVANVALGDLDSARSDALVALGELDALYAAESVRASETGESGNADAASAAHAEVGALVAEEEALLAGLRSRLR